MKEKCKLLTTVQSHNEKKYNRKEIKHTIVAKATFKIRYKKNKMQLKILDKLV